MPISKIQVNEYNCIKCGYKWINRLNGVDGPVPKRCANCKRVNWDKGSRSSEEIGLRRRICYLKTLYEETVPCFRGTHGIGEEVSYHWPKGLTETFLSLNLTIHELKCVLYPPRLKLDLNSQNRYTRRGYVPHPNKRGWFRYNPKEWTELVKRDAQKQQEIMQQIIDSRRSR